MAELYSHQFNALLAPRHMDALNELAEHLHSSRAHIVRRCIDALHAMEILRVPHCANGTRCLVPHLHQHPDQVTPPAPKTPP